MIKSITQTLFKGLMCQHQWQAYSLSDVKCAKCGIKKYDQELATKLIDKKMAGLAWAAKGRIMP